MCILIGVRCRRDCHAAKKDGRPGSTGMADDPPFVHRKSSGVYIFGNTMFWTRVMTGGRPRLRVTSGFPYCHQRHLVPSTEDLWRFFPIFPNSTTESAAVILHIWRSIFMRCDVGLPVLCILLNCEYQLLCGLGLAPQLSTSDVKFAAARAANLQLWITTLTSNLCLSCCQSSSRLILPCFFSTFVRKIKSKFIDNRSCPQWVLLSSSSQFSSGVKRQS